MTFRALAAAVAVLMSSAAWAQDPVRTAGSPPDAADIRYESGGRRDPFMSLVVPRRPASTGAAMHLGRRPSGLGGLSLSDVQVRGVVKAGADMTAIVEGPDNQSFVLRVKDRLFDAEVKSIDPRGVVFVERVETPTGVQARDVRRTLRPAGEGGGR